MSKYIEFVPLDRPDLKTKIWRVQPIGEPGILLGHVKWFGRWRRYALFTEPMTVFEKDCLRTLADFCEMKTKAHRDGSRTKTVNTPVNT